jgi:hypothetical protein
MTTQQKADKILHSLKENRRFFNYSQIGYELRVSSQSLNRIIQTGNITTKQAERLVKWGEMMGFAFGSEKAVESPEISPQVDTKPEATKKNTESEPWKWHNPDESGNETQSDLSEQISSLSTTNQFSTFISSLSKEQVVQHKDELLCAMKQKLNTTQVIVISQLLEAKIV